MSEYVWTVITVGGAVKRSDLAKLQSVVEACAAEDDSGYGSDYLPIGGQELRFAGQFNFGNLPTGCAEILQELGLSYRVRYDAGGDWSPGILQWSPENGLQECGADTGDPVRSLQELEKAFNEGRTLADVIAALRPFKADLPPITIVEDVATDCQAAAAPGAAETAGHGNGFMDVAAALQIVLDLARQNLADERDMPDEHARQLVALSTVEDMAVNQLGDE